MFSQEMKSSGYTREKTREVVIGGTKGWKRKIARREAKGQEFYREATKTLKGRVRKKLLERETWFKEKDDEEEDLPEGWTKNNRDRGGWKHDENNPEGWKKKENKKMRRFEIVKAVMVVPHTKNSELARRYRKNEFAMEKITDWRFKIVERTGRKVQDILTTSNPWKGKDCERERCLHCDTKERTNKYKSQDCSKRSVVYETWCIKCERKEVEKLKRGKTSLRRRRRS